MTRRLHGATVAICYLLLAGPVAAQQYYLYSPKATTPDEAVPAKEGVLVREVPVQKGDTLSGLSRKFSGHGSYFPQILLFNQIKNPNLIYAGDTIKVPVTKAETPAETKTPARGAKPAQRHSGVPGTKQKHAVPAPAPHAKAQPGQPVTELSLSDLKQTEAAKKKKAKQVTRHAKIHKPHEPKAQPPAGGVPTESTYTPQQPAPTAEDALAGQKLFERAVKAYHQDDCRTALQLFDRFLADNAGSPLAADASLYKAECYLKQSKQ